MTNEIAPYCMTNDNAIMMIFVLNIIGISYVFLMNGAGILERIKCMFYYESKSTPFSSRTHITRVCNALLYMQTVFYFAIIASEFAIENSHYTAKTTIMPLAVTLAGVFVAVMLFKLLSYSAVNAILFDKQRIRAWNDFYFFTIKLLGFAFFPAVIAILFVPEIPFNVVGLYLIFVLIVYVYTVLSGVVKIIFAQKRIFLDIFLYLCALEFLPMGIVWKSILQVSEFLTIKN